jgi:tRNA 2-thiouridine synthesizing protein E
MNAMIKLPLPERDNEGYLSDPVDWTADLAHLMAAEAGLELGDEHWQVLGFIRDYYAEHQAVPEARTLLRGLPWGTPREAKQRLYHLFPGGYGQQACKIAGMRKPLKLMLDV